MKITLLTQRRSRCRGSPTISLFPFLAVLICTMGALVPLLLAIARQARLEALQEATAKAAQRHVDAQADQEMAEWRIGELANSRKLAQQQLTQARLALGHVENHARRLRQQAGQLRTTLENLDKTGMQSGRQRAELDGELTQLQTQISQAEKQLSAAQQEAGSRPRSYAVIPYQGPHGTYRRPIYVECRADAIVLQPEGIALTEADFDGPLEAGNALDRALRAARETLLAQKRIKGDGSDEPYPLLLVRPDGIIAYYAARAAMKSWKSEIGYELVGKDWELEFPHPDPEIGRALREAVAEARQERRRQAVLVAMLANAKSQTGYRAPFGAGPMKRGERGDGRGERGEDGGRGLVGGVVPGVPGRVGSGLRPQASRAQTPEVLETLEVSAGAAPRTGAAPKTPGLASDAAMAAAVFGAPKSARNDSRVTYRVAPGGGGLIQEVEPAAGSGPTGRAASQRAALRPGEWNPQESKPSPGPKDKQRPDNQHEHGDGKSKRLADSRGENWGLPNAARGSVGITRPIRVRCSSNRLEILPDDAHQTANKIPLGERTEDAVEDFVSAVWEHMKRWGIAGRGMHWRPILRIEVTPDAEFRYAELKTLLDDSGLIVERSQ